MNGHSERMSIKTLGIVALILLTSAIGAVEEALYCTWAGLNRLILRRR